MSFVWEVKVKNSEIFVSSTYLCKMGPANGASRLNHRSYGLLDRGMMYVATTLPLEVFAQRNFVVPGLSPGVVCLILRLAVLIQYWRVTHRHAIMMTANTRANIASRG